MNSGKRIFRIVTVIMVFALIGAAFAALAQGDSDGDGLPDTADRCPTQAGSRENSGCPTQVDQQADADGDGVADFVDQCPNEAGTGFSNGCPFNLGPIALPTLEPQGETVVIIWERIDVCMVGVPLTASNSVNVRQNPTVNSPIVGTLSPGDQFEPYFRDYDENNAVWFGYALGWVAGSVVIDNGECAYLPQIIHVDAPQTPSIDVTFDFDTVPQFDPGADDEPTFGDLLALDPPLLIVIDDPLPDEGAPPAGDAEPPPELFKMGDGSVKPGDQLILIFGSVPDAPESECLPLPGGACLDAVAILPPVGDAPGQCTPDMLAGRLAQIKFGVGDSFEWNEEDGLTDGDLKLTDGEDAALIGLLLPAVQKVREAAARIPMADGAFGDGSVIPAGENMQDFHFLVGEGGVNPPDPSVDASVIPTDPCSFGLLLPAVQEGGITDGTMDGFLIGLP